MEIVVLLSIAILLFLAKLFGEIAERLKVDALVGEVLAGLLAGPILLIVMPNALLQGIADIGIILLVFLIGLETKFDDLREHLYNASSLAIVACLASLIGGFVIGYFMFDSMKIGIFFGIALMGTSTAIPVRILMERGMYKTRVGQFLITSSMGDDIITILGLSFLSAYLAGTANMWSSIQLFFVILGFMLAIVTVGSKVATKALNVVQRLKDENAMLAIPLAIVFAITFFAENIGVAAIVGSFLAGMLMSKSQFAETVIAPKVKTIGYGIFIPIFFAYSAVIMSLAHLSGYVWLIIILTVVAILTKVISSGIMAQIFGFRGRERDIIAIGMIPRGECGIVISQIALVLGAITNEIYGAMLLLILITVVITPILYSFILREHGRYKR